jgi:hypothetical protein
MNALPDPEDSPLAVRPRPASRRRAWRPPSTTVLERPKQTIRRTRWLAGLATASVLATAWPPRSSS